jgi:hypothetical protein
MYENGLMTNELIITWMDGWMNVLMNLYVAELMNTFTDNWMGGRLRMAVFWVVAPCSLVEVYQRFRGPCCLHHQGDD